MIRFANLSDVDTIMGFIDAYWRKGHIMGNNKEFFLYQHNMLDELAYVINELEDGSINAVLGYIPYGKENRDIMLALWKVQHSSDPMLGIRMLQYLIEKSDARIVSCPGINKKTRGIYEYMGYYTGKMKQWYRLRKQDNYQIARIENSFIPTVEKNDECKLIRIDTFEELREKFDFGRRKREEFVPYKEEWYLEKRYYKHPVYKYDVYGVEYQGEVKLVIVTRKIECNNSQVIRVIDCIGDFNQIVYITYELDRLLDENHAEYIDFLEAGLSDSALMQAGWLNVAETENVIPEYFSPYECKNVDIFYFSTQENIVLFKGDGDQDRPN